jgi:hypothetical protein
MFISTAQFTFKHGWAWRIFMALVSLALVAYAVVEYRDSHEIDPWYLRFVIACVALTVFAFIAIGKIEVRGHDEGLVRVSLFGVREMPWNDVAEYRYRQVPVNYAVHFGLIGYIIMLFTRNGSAGNLQRRLKIKGRDGSVITISENVRNNEEVIRLVLSRIQPRLLSEARTMLDSGAGVSFGKITVSRNGLSLKGKDPVPYANLGKPKIDGQKLRIKAQGKWLDLVAANCDTIPNIFILLDLVDEQMAKAGVSTQDVLRATSQTDQFRTK